jgi:hypothetical protein
MTNDTPPVAPVEGFYAMLRNGCVVHPDCITKEFDLDGTPYYLPANSDEEYHWTPHGVCQRQAYPNGEPKTIYVPDLDIIATISPEAMALVANGGLEALEAELGQCNQDNGDWTYENQLLKSKIAELTALADAVLDHADSHCRAFPIATAPLNRWVQVWNSNTNVWMTACLVGDFVMDSCYTHWGECLPPPTNPPLPEVFVELGQALEKIKGAT